MLLAGDISYTYDLNGNMISQTSDNGDIAYSYDYNNELLSVYNNNSVINYTYDYAGNRMRKSVDGQESRYLWNVNSDYAKLISETQNGELKVYYTYGNELISQRRNDSYSYYISDHQLSTRYLADANGNITDTYDYDAFGKLTSSTGETENEFLYTGQQYDSNIGYYYLRARYMDTQNGRFINRDYYEGDIYEPTSLHKYTYVHNNPVMGYDPTGLILWFFARGILAHRYIEDRYWSEHPNQSEKHQYVRGEGRTGYIDICDHNTKEIYEIKPYTCLDGGQKQLDFYLRCMNGYKAGISWPIHDKKEMWPLGGTITYGLRAPGLIYYRMDGDDKKLYAAVLATSLAFVADAATKKYLVIETMITNIGRYYQMGVSQLMAQVDVAVARSPMTGGI